MGRAMTRGPKPSEGTAPLRSRDGARSRRFSSPARLDRLKIAARSPAGRLSRFPIIAELRFRRDAQTVIASVPGSFTSCSQKSARKTGEMTLVRQIVARYANRLTPEILAATGADRFQLIQFAQSPQRAGHERSAYSFAAGTLA